MVDSVPTAIKVENVSKSFKLPHEKQNSIKGLLINLFRKSAPGTDRQQVLKDVSLEIKKGEFFGIVGRNGSGKSTLLKLLAQIYSPDEGSIQISGKLTPFIELGVGFNPELTGRENVFLNGALLGFNRKQVAGMYDEIVAFAELEEFMDLKLKNYSSGMQVRLAFAVAIRSETDILLIDEVLAVGDQSFQEKCFEYFARIKQSDKTVVFVTHDMSNVERFCDRVYMIDKKKSINGLYSVPQAVSLYNQLNHEVEAAPSEPAERKTFQSSISFDTVRLLNAEGVDSRTFKVGEALDIEITINSKTNKTMPLLVGIAIYDTEGSNTAGPNSASVKLTTADGKITYHLPAIPFNMGEYRLTLALYDDKSVKQYDYLDKEIKFFVNSDEIHHGKFVLEGTWLK